MRSSATRPRVRAVPALHVHAARPAPPPGPGRRDGPARSSGNPSAQSSGTRGRAGSGGGEGRGRVVLGLHTTLPRPPARRWLGVDPGRWGLPPEATSGPRTRGSGAPRRATPTRRTAGAARPGPPPPVPCRADTVAGSPVPAPCTGSAPWPEDPPHRPRGSTPARIERSTRACRLSTDWPPTRRPNGHPRPTRSARAVAAEGAAGGPRGGRSADWPSARWPIGHRTAGRAIPSGPPPDGRASGRGARRGFPSTPRSEPWRPRGG